ncbi:unnamed protein product [Arabis nemorensis]|uniref:Peptidase C1A papain C-terminal domain-containing protein n=1 Tax=Arabis nemorensis TaxID=586526 RepID=A0A565BJH5_9BRAS|nr:unnamed protein product [Arabis nemorensis]
MDIGGKKDDKDNRKKRKGKEKVEKDLDEEELPRNKKYMPKTERIDRFAIIDNVDDVELARLVWKHPVVGVVPVWGDFQLYRQGIYKPPKSSESRTYPIYHAVLIVGFGVDEHGNQFWIIQNSAGLTWGEGGFGRLHRERGGRKSLFSQVYYGEKKGYPEKDK